MTTRAIITTLAAAYSLAGVAALVIGFVISWDDPLAPIYALLLGAPWTFLLSAVDGFAENSVVLNAVLLAAAIAINAALLWGLALTRRGSTDDLRNE